MNADDIRDIIARGPQVVTTGLTGATGQSPWTSYLAVARSAAIHFRNTQMNAGSMLDFELEASNQNFGMFSRAIQAARQEARFR